ncbi:MAG: hypothetical protein ABIS67_11980 [Candidatus Eisenbacteria bacterium]
MTRFTRPLTALLVLAAALALGAGCGRNDAVTVLAPTGIRPAPAVWPGSLTGLVEFDPTNAPDLSAPPFPPTRIELYRDGSFLIADSLEISSRSYEFGNLPPGSYSIVVRSSSFFANSRGGLPVRDYPLDAGNLVLTLNPSVFSNGVDIIGSMPGFGVDQFGSGTTSLDQNVLGVWTYPNALYPAENIAAGVYRLKFVTDMSSTNSNLIGWGGSAAETLTVPVSGRRAVRGSGPATDLRVRFPATGAYAFELDERRQTFSIMAIPPAPAADPRR